MLQNTIILLVVIFLISGCWGFSRESPVRDEFDGIRFSIKPGFTTRDQVRKLLGEPSVTSNRWRVDVYRAISGRDAEVGMFVYIPVYFSTTEVILYALIVYDENNIVEDIDWDVLEADIEGGVRDPADVKTRLIAGGFQFRIVKPYFQSKRAIILAPKIYSQHLLNIPSQPNTCSLFLALHNAMELVSLNGKTLIEDLYEYAFNTIPAFLMLSIPNGEYQLNVRTWRGDYLRMLSCKINERYYIKFETTFLKSEKMFNDEILISDTPYEIFYDRQQLLYIDEQWIVPY